MEPLQPIRGTEPGPILPWQSHDRHGVFEALFQAGQGLGSESGEAFSEGLKSSSCLIHIRSPKDQLLSSMSTWAIPLPDSPNRPL